MIFDVMVREGFNAVGKQIISVLRIRDISLNVYLRKVQDEKKYIIAVIPLFRKREEVVKRYINESIVGDEEGEEGEVAADNMMKGFRASITPIEEDRLDKSCIDTHGF